MEEEKAKRLKAKGWTIGSTEDLLGMSQIEVDATKCYWCPSTESLQPLFGHQACPECYDEYRVGYPLDCTEKAYCREFFRKAQVGFWAEVRRLSP